MIFRHLEKFNVMLKIFWRQPEQDTDTEQDIHSHIIYVCLVNLSYTLISEFSMKSSEAIKTYIYFKHVY